MSEDLEPIEKAKNPLEIFYLPSSSGEVHRYYRKSEADKVIAELKDKCQMHDFFWEGCGFARRGFKNTISVSEEFDRIEAENAQLRKENKRLKEPSPQKWMAVTSPPKNMREVWIRTADGSSILGHYNYSKKEWYEHDAYNPVEAVGWQELGPVVSEEYAFLEAENAQLKEAVAVYQRNEKFDIRTIHQLKRELRLMRENNAEDQCVNVQFIPNNPETRKMLVEGTLYLTVYQGATTICRSVYAGNDRWKNPETHVLAENAVAFFASASVFDIPGFKEGTDAD